MIRSIPTPVLVVVIVIHRPRPVLVLAVVDRLRLRLRPRGRGLWITLGVVSTIVNDDRGAEALAGLSSVLRRRKCLPLLLLPSITLVLSCLLVSGVDSGGTYLISTTKVVVCDDEWT